MTHGDEMIEVVRESHRVETGRHQQQIAHHERPPGVSQTSTVQSSRGLRPARPCRRLRRRSSG